MELLGGIFKDRVKRFFGRHKFSFFLFFFYELTKIFRREMVLIDRKPPSE